jgi:hypothetical protein
VADVRRLERAQAERLTGLRANDSVDGEAVPALEALDGLVGGRAEDPVPGQPQAALDVADGLAAVALADRDVDARGTSLRGRLVGRGNRRSHARGGQGSDDEGARVQPATAGTTRTRRYSSINIGGQRLLLLFPGAYGVS